MYTAMLLEAAVVLLCVGLVLSSAWEGQVANERSEDLYLLDRDRYVMEAAAVASEWIGSYALQVATLARSDEFNRPQTIARDQAREASITVPQAAQIAFYDGVESILPSEEGPPVAFSPANWARLEGKHVWQLTRGLPLRLQGQLLARQRRLAADSVVRRDQAVVAVAELDERGAVLYMVPYRLQVGLRAANFGSIVPAIRSALQGTAPAVIAHDRLPDVLDGPLLSLVHRIPDRSPAAFLVLTVRRPVAFSTSASWRLIGTGGETIMEGKAAQVADADLMVLERPLEITSVSYTLQVALPSPPAAVSVGIRLVLALGIVAV